MNKTISLIAVVAAFVSLLTAESFAAANQFKVGAMVVENPWARATMSRAKNGAAYVTIKNTGTASDRLLSVTSPISKMAGVHQSVMTNGMMKMIPVKALVIGPGETVTFKPGGYHIMFMGLAAPLKKGRIFPMTLTFEKAGAVDVRVMVMKAGAMGRRRMEEGGATGKALHHETSVMDMKPNP